MKEHFDDLGFTVFVNKAELDIIEDEDIGWDIRNIPSENKIVLNLSRLRWYLEREKIIKHCPKYDLETAFIHDLFEFVEASNPCLTFTRPTIPHFFFCAKAYILTDS